jgi:replicative DNA helicase
VPPVNEHRIIAKAITEEDIRPLLDRGVTPSWFFNLEHRQAYENILDHHTKYGITPTRVTFKKAMGGYQIFAVTESYEHLIDEQAKTLRWTAMRAALPDIDELLKEGDVEAAAKLYADTLVKVNSYMPMRTTLVDTMDNDAVEERWREYEDRRRGKRRGLPTGFPTIDKATLGLQPGHLVTVVSQPKVGKTTLCLAMANYVHTIEEKPILFVTYEMSTSEMGMRQDSLLAKINFRRLQAGKLTKSERQRYRHHMDHVKVDYTWPFRLMDANTGTTVSVIEGQIERLQPKVVFIDGIYLMRDERTGETNTPQAITSITRSLKQVAIRKQVPIVINTQALAWKSKGQKINADSIGYSSSFLQDSDVVLGLERIQPAKGVDAEAHELQRNLRVLASRNSGLATVEIVFDYDEGEIQEAT